jgi:hypothetical protein
MNFLTSLVPHLNAYLVLAATVVAAAASIAKSMELVVATLSALFPNAAKANPFLNSVIAVCTKLGSNPLIKGLALHPAAPASPPAPPAKSGGSGAALITALLLGTLCALPARAQTPAAPASTAVSSPASTAPAAGTSLALPPINWNVITFQHGPSAQLFLIDPKNPHPVEVPAGEGYSAGAGFGQLTLNGASVSLLNVSGQAFLSIIAPQGQAEGGVEVAFMLGFLSNAVAVGPLLTPYVADGTGFLQGGRPGTKWVATVNPVALWHLLGGN